MKCLLVLAPMALASCNSGPSVEATNATAKQVAEKVAAAGAAPHMSPGRWEGTATVTSMEMPGMPPEMGEKMKTQMSKAHPFSNCLTPEQAKKPAADFFSGGGAEGCVYDHFSMASGALDAAMTCKGRGPGGTMHATMKGNFSNDNFQLAMTSKSAGAPGQPMSSFTMAMKMEAKRVGECTGKEDS
jgi:hypothetical protein